MKVHLVREKTTRELIIKQAVSCHFTTTRLLRKLVISGEIHSMSKEEIKTEINKVLDQLPGKTLEGILQLLKKIEQKEHPFTVNQGLIDKILKEDADLLHKLAQ